MCKNLRESDRRRPSCDDDATVAGMIAVQGLGKIGFTYMNIYCYCCRSCCQHDEGQKLT
ncbi:MAG: hypothetical protein K6E15_10930 [Prevotella sp.]|nr:hypothetical protein [Prevotella sp.]